MRARTRNKASLPSSELPRAAERPMSSATCLRACRRPKTGPEVDSDKATASRSPRRRRRKASMRWGGQEEMLAMVRFLTLPFSRKDSRMRMAGGEVRVGDFPDVRAYRIRHTIVKVNAFDIYYMTTISFAIDANSFQANDLLENEGRRSARSQGICHAPNW